MTQSYDVIILGAGASGLFTAINIAEGAPHKRILILEKGKEAPDRPRKAKPRPQYQNGTSPHSGELLRIRRNPLSLGPRGYKR